MIIKTVIIVNDFNYTQGGASKVAIDTAKILKQNNINVIFFSADTRDDEKIEGVEYITTDQKEALKEKNRIKGALNGIYNLKARNKFKRLLKELDKETTLIHIHGWTKALSCSVFDIAFKMKFKVVLTLHDYFTACPNGGFFNYKKNEICKLTPLSWKCIKCNCDSRNYGFKLYRVIRQFVQNKIVKLPKNLKYAIGISDLNINVLKPTFNNNIKLKKIYNPIEYSEKEAKAELSKNDYYIYVGRLSKEKGIEIFCDAISSSNQKGIVVGDGDERKRLEQKYKNIKFVGWKDKKEVKEYLKNAKALILPSLWYEGAPLTPLEAISVGVPCLISDYCSAREYIIDKKNGCVFLNTDDLIDKIKKIEDKTLEFKIDYNFLKKFNQKEYYENLIQFYKS